MKKLLILFLAVACWGQNAIERQLQCQDAGANDTYTCSIPVAPAAYVTGQHYRFMANTANTGAATINFNSLGAKTIKKAAGGITTDLSDNDIRAGQWVDLVYDGTNMQMQSTLGNSSSGATTQSYTRRIAHCASNSPEHASWAPYEGTATPICTYSPNGGSGYAVFPEAATNSMVGTVEIPVNTDISAGLTVKILTGVGGSPSGNARWGVSTSCVAADTTNWTWNTESLQTISEGSTPSAYIATTFSGVATTNCTAFLRDIVVRVRRLPADAADTTTQDEFFFGATSSW